MAGKIKIWREVSNVAGTSRLPGGRDYINRNSICIWREGANLSGREKEGHGTLFVTPPAAVFERVHD